MGMKLQKCVRLSGKIDYLQNIKMLNLIISLVFYSFDFKSSFLQQYIMGTREIRRNNIIFGGNFSAQMGHNVAKYFINNRFLKE